MVGGFVGDAVNNATIDSEKRCGPRFTYGIPRMAASEYCRRRVVIIRTFLPMVGGYGYMAVREQATKTAG